MNMDRQRWDLAPFIGQTAEVNGDHVAQGGQRYGICFKGNPLKADDGKWMSGRLGTVK